MGVLSSNRRRNRRGSESRNDGENGTGRSLAGSDGDRAGGSSGMGGRRRPTEDRVRRQSQPVLAKRFSGASRHAFAERDSASGRQARIIPIPAVAQRSDDRLGRNHPKGKIGGGPPGVATGPQGVFQ